MKVKWLCLAAALQVSFSAVAEPIKFVQSLPEKADVLVLSKPENQQLSQSPKVNADTLAHVNRAIEGAEFKGQYASFLNIQAPIQSDYDAALLMGIGDKALDKPELTKLGANLSTKVAKESIDSIHIIATGLNAIQAAQLAHGINLRSYKFDKYLKDKKQERSYVIKVADVEKARAAYNKLANIEEAVFWARDLTNEVPTALGPIELVKEAKKLKKLGVKIKVLKPKQIKKLGMGALEAVGRGSVDGSRLIVAHYQGSDDTPIALIGKGLTFDSGGYNIKTHASIAYMKVDMAGSAAVLGTVKALAANKEKINVVAVVGVAENLVSEHSFLPGDVLQTAEGHTVEIINTDAEGRLVLSDAMWYARKHFNPEIMVDVATLTGSKIRAIGSKYAGLFSEDEQLVKQLTVAGKTVNEPVWRLPLDYKEKLETPIADLRNTGSGGPGASTAAMFLQHFAGDTRWAHLDIAGNSTITAPKDESPVGGTGFGVRLLTEWLTNLEK